MLLSHTSAFPAVLGCVRIEKSRSCRGLQTSFVLTNDVLYRKHIIGGEPLFQLVLPKAFRQVALSELHDSVGHLGIERTVDLVRQRFIGPEWHWM